jgi:DNA-directed RNA polymerase specialized sigma24 family protein
MSYSEANPITNCAECGNGGASAEGRWAGLCARCRMRALNRGRGRITPEIREHLRREYHGDRARRVAVVDYLQRISGRTLSRAAIQAEASRLGLTHDVRRPWTPEEDEWLREHAGERSIHGMARHLGRSYASVQCRCKRLCLLMRVSSGYNQGELAQAFGVDPSTVARWMRRGLLGKTHGQNPVRVMESNVITFVRQYPHEYDLRRVDQVWYKALVFGDSLVFQGREGEQ